jgi:hypothetical protein
MPKTSSKIQILGKEYTKSEVKKIAQQILHKYKPGEKLKGKDLEFILELLKYHPEYKEKTKFGVKGIVVRTYPLKKDTKQFRIITDDGREIEFSYLKCIYPKTHKQKVMRAFREAIADQIIEFKKKYFKKNKPAKCQVSRKPITWYNCHVDHVIPFKVLVEQFLKEHNLTFDDIEIEDSPIENRPPRIKDENLRHAWQEFHKKHAILRVVAPDIHKDLSTKKKVKGQKCLIEFI